MALMSMVAIPSASAPEDLRFCVNCQHRYETYLDADSRTRGPDRCDIPARSLVHGEMGHPMCEWSRSQQHLCGPSGAFFRSK